MYRSILVPLDGSGFGRHALPVAAAIARRTGGRVHLAHVHVPVEAVEVFGGLTDPDSRAAERSFLEEVARALAAAGVPAETALLDGPTVRALQRHAKECRADLVVMTTHGRGPLARFALGSVADPLVRRLPVPVLLVRPGEDPPDLGRAAPPRHLLIALDGSERAEAMLPAAVGLGELVGARVTLLRVVGPPELVIPDPNGLLIPCQDPGATDRLRRDALAYLERLAAPWRQRGLDVRARAVVGADPAAAILEEAGALGCDLIALETHGRRGLARLVLGSVTDRVVREAAAPVLTHSPAGGRATGGSADAPAGVKSG
jgi:nucleotide-binding universal stress UspA family protein